MRRNSLEVRNRLYHLINLQVLTNAVCIMSKKINTLTLTVGIALGHVSAIVPEVTPEAMSEQWLLPPFIYTNRQNPANNFCNT